MGLLKHIHTGINGETYDIGRIAASAGVVVGLGLMIYSVVVRGAVFDFQSFGIGFGALAAGVGAMLKLKETTEPK